jgi:hypothetical protein
MDLEAEVMETLLKRRRRVKIQQAAILSTLVAMFAAVLVFVIIPFAAGNTKFSDLVEKARMTGIVWVAVVVAIVLGVVVLAFTLLSRSRDLRYFAALTRGAKGYDLKALGRFMKARDDMAARTGALAPTISVLDNDTPNALTFAGANGPVMGITEGALEADLKDSEIDSIVAHELAAAIARDYLRRPYASKFEVVSNTLLWFVAMATIVAVPITKPGHSNAVPLLVAGVVLAYLILVSLWMRRFAKSQERDDVLVDSIAIKMTGDIDTMESTLRSIDKLVSYARSVPFPDSELGLRYLLVPPHRWTENALAFMKRRSKDLDYNLNEKAAHRRVDALQSDMDLLAGQMEGLLAARMNNIRDIRKGTWTAFE